MSTMAPAKNDLEDLDRLWRARNAIAQWGRNRGYSTPAPQTWNAFFVEFGDKPSRAGLRICVEHETLPTDKLLVVWSEKPKLSKDAAKGLSNLIMDPSVEARIVVVITQEGKTSAGLKELLRLTRRNDGDDLFHFMEIELSTMGQCMTCGIPITENRIRAKAACEWGDLEESYFRLETNSLEPEVFFGVSELPELEEVAPGILQHSLASIARQAKDREAIRFLDFMEDAIAGNENNVDIFAHHILDSVLGFTDNGDTVKQQKSFDFVMCSVKKSAKADVCLMDGKMGIDAIVMHQENKRDYDVKFPLGQIVATTVGVFGHNNSCIGLSRKNEVVIPAVVLLNTAVVFCRIPMSRRLADCIARGVVPDFTTIIDVCKPGTAEYHRMGFANMPYRRLALQCFKLLRDKEIPKFKQSLLPPKKEQGSGMAPNLVSVTEGIHAIKLPEIDEERRVG